MFNVGQGASFLLEFPNGEIGIFDCCKKQEDIEPPILAHLKSLIKFPDCAFVALSHPHEDHYTGLLDVLEYLRKKSKVRHFLLPSLTEKQMRQLLEAEQKSATNEKLLRDFNELYGIIKHVVIESKKTRGYVVYVGPRVSLKVGEVVICAHGLTPVSRNQVLRTFTNEKPADYNNLSIFLSFDYRDKRFLLTGDSPKVTWGEYESICGSGESALFHISEIPHHGSRHNFPKRQWGRLQAKNAVALISAGPGYQHPHFETLSALLEAGADIRCTNIAPGCEIIESQDFSFFDDVSAEVLAQLLSMDLGIGDVCQPCQGNVQVTIDSLGNIDVHSENSRSCLARLRAFDLR